MNNVAWSPEEDKLLKALWGNPLVDMDDLEKILKLRTKEAIKKRAQFLGFPPYTDMVKDRIDHDYLKKLGMVTEG